MGTPFSKSANETAEWPIYVHVQYTGIAGIHVFIHITSSGHDIHMIYTCQVWS